MKFELPSLPYPKDALEPHVSARTVEVHYESHHRGYLTKLEKAIAGTPEAGRSLEDIIRSSEGSVFNNAAQVWNHTFYWTGMKRGGGGKPRGTIGDELKAAFGGIQEFQEAFVREAVQLFGSGYLWLVSQKDGTGLALRPMKDAGNPLVSGEQPLLCIDVWEHAYYLDYQSGREKYVRGFLAELANWEFADANLAAARAATQG
jgi:Fe-Mn family superoxide dismutase